MRRLLVIPGLLFGLFFAGGGFFMASETSLPMWQNWQRMQGWQPNDARLLSFSGAENETRVHYRYEYGGASYRSKNTGVVQFKDNIGSWHRDMQALLGRIKRGDEALRIWVNPFDPAQAVIDRDMRWGLFALVNGFYAVFILIGLAVIYASIRSANKIPARHRPSLWDLRKRWQQAQADGSTNLGFLEYCQELYAESQAPEPDDTPPLDWQSRKGWEDARIKSDAGKGMLFLWGFAIVWNAVSIPVSFVLPRELQQENYAALLILLFPAVGLFLIYKAIQRTLEYRRFGRVLVTLDPFPGATGGHVGGHIQVKNLDYRRASEAQTLAVTLECVYSYVSGSGKNRSRRESIKWVERGQPKIDNAIEGINLVFRFDVPDDLPQADVEQSGAYHFWRLGVSVEVPGIDLNRSYNIPVFATGETSRNVSHDISAQAAAARKQEADAAGLAIASGQFDIEGLSRALRLRQEGNRIHLKYPMFRNKFLTLFAAIFAAGFGFACYSMVDMISGGGVFGIFIAIFSIPFFLVALVAAFATIYLPFNNLSVSIQPGEVSVLRRLLIFPVYRRQLQQGDISHLAIKRSGSTGQGADKIEHFKIHAVDTGGKKVTLAEDIDGEDVAMHFRDYLAQRIGVVAK
ncbi:MAG: DUF3592 domain-containing protein [Gammaproteobacteria bacterium]|nr:DUF3592 domain-containing protein [Gammaproteobacteria bacterium]